MNNLVISTKKRNLIIGISLSLIIMIIGTTYAYFTWQSSNNPLVDITVEDMADVVFKGGNDIDITDIGPVLDYNDGEITEFYIKKKIEDNLDLSINITPTLLPDNLKHESFKVKLLSSNDNITYNEVSEINFKDKEQDTKYELSVVELNQNKTYYKIIFYIDGNMYNPNTIQGNSFRARIDVSVNTKCPINTVTPVYTDNSGANAPVLAEGMIPVVYDEGLGYWIKADTNAGWYNYTDKIWANAVMVKTDATEGVECSKSRADYMSSPAYTPVKEEDILAYYVWIPRYKYQLFNATYASGTSSQLIDVVFENGTSTTGTVTCTYDTSGNETCTNKSNGNYYTHPAFTFGDTELKGIWVGKFETTGSKTTPTVKPGISSLAGITVSSMYSTGQLFRSTDYLTTNGVSTADSHMMKNIEWGAVAYLKQSIYGLGTTDIANNNSYGYITGRSTGDPIVTSSTSEGTYKYNEPKIEKELVEGTGTELTIATPASDSTYTWTNIGTSDSPIWKSANQGVASSSTTLTYTFTLTGQGVLSFDYSASSESASFDYLYYTIKQGDNIIDSTGTSTKIGGTSYGTADVSMTYVSKTHILEVGTYTLEFTYRKDSSDDSGTDSGYVKNVKVIDGAEARITYLIEQGGGAASTTGNVTGIYDMAGGSWEYVMGNLSKNTGDSGLNVSGIPAEHIDIYSGTSVAASHLGDATGETARWYNDKANFVNSSYPWFRRGGHYGGGVDAGVFLFSFGAGVDNGNYGFRVVLSTTGA
ncbi:MAG: hypothetical protein ACI312_03390 [Bacilli bacterium]